MKESQQFITMMKETPQKKGNKIPNEFELEALKANHIQHI